MTRRCAGALGVAALVALLGPASGARAGNPTHRVPLFRTPGQAADCYFWPGGLEPTNPGIGCWTPDDGFTVTVAFDEPRGRENERKTYLPSNRRRTPAGYRLLRFRRTFRVRCDVSGHAVDDCLRGGREVAFRCVSRSSGLTCTNRVGRGFWLGRYVGYRVF